MKSEEQNTLGIFERRDTTKDEFGQESDTWVEVARGALGIRTITTREKLRAGALGSELTHTISTGYNRALLPMVRISELRIRVTDTTVSPQDRIFNIRGGQDVNEEHQWFLLDCTEGTIDGQ